MPALPRLISARSRALVVCVVLVAACIALGMPGCASALRPCYVPAEAQGAKYPPPESGAFSAAALRLETRNRSCCGHEWDEDEGSSVEQSFRITNVGSIPIALSDIAVKFWLYDTTQNKVVSSVRKGGVVRSGGCGGDDGNGEEDEEDGQHAVEGVRATASAFTSGVPCGPDAFHQANREVVVTTSDPTLLRPGERWTQLRTEVRLTGREQFEPGPAAWFSSCREGRRWRQDSHYAVYVQGKLVYTDGIAAPECRAPHGQQQLAGYRGPAISSAPLVGRVAADTWIDLGIGLPLRNRAALETFNKQVSDPKNPQYRHYLTASEFTARYSPTQSDLQGVLDFAQRVGLRVAGISPDRLYVHAAAPAAVVERAFFANLNEYRRADGSHFYGLDREPSANVATPLLRVSGLDTYALPIPLLGSGPGVGAFMGDDFRRAYVDGAACTPLKGAGQCIGLFEMESFAQADIDQYNSVARLPALTPTKLATPTLGGFLGITGPPFTTSTALTRQEVMGDVEVAHAMAPAADVVAFTGINIGGTSEVNAILHLMPGRCNQIASSWSVSFDQNSAEVFQEFIALGQSFFQASGDSGAYVAEPTGIRDGASPFATLVGGTILSMNGFGVSWKAETTWPSGGGGILNGAPFTCVPGSPLPCDAGYSTPDYQLPLVTAANRGSTRFRNAPDVSANAGPTLVVSDGNIVSLVAGGTSMSAPLWAGFMALANERGGANNLRPVGFANPVLYAIGGSARYTDSFHDVNDGSQNNNVTPGAQGGPVPGFPAVAGYDLATGLGSPRCGLIEELGGGGVSPPPPPPGTAKATAGVTETNVGPDICVSGVGFKPGGTVTVEYDGIPKSMGPRNGKTGSVAPDGSFALARDTGVEFIIASACTQAQLHGLVLVTVRETDGSGAVISTATDTIPGAYWCNAPVATNYKGGCH